MSENNVNPTAPSTSTSPNDQKGKGKSKWYDRSVARAPDMVMTARDIRILESLDAYRYLTAGQIQSLHWDTQISVSCRVRLRKLFVHGYVDRIPLQDGFQRGSVPVYVLSQKGAVALAEIRSASGKELDWSRKHKDVKPLFIQHWLALNDVRIAFTRAAKREGHELRDWRYESEVWDEYEVLDGQKGAKTRKQFRPDAWLVYTAPSPDHPTRRIGFAAFIELDRATESGTRWRTEVVPRYQTYLASGRFAQQFKPLERFWVLVVTTSWARARHLAEIVSASDIAHVFWLTVQKEVTSETILNPIWIRPGIEGQQALLVRSQKD